MPEPPAIFRSATMTESTLDRPWETLHTLVAAGDTVHIEQILNQLGSLETARAISRMSVEDRNRLLTLIAPEDAADVMAEISYTQAADLIEDLPPDQAAAIINAIPSDRQADLLGELGEDEARAILGEMSPDDANDARRLLAYSPDTAGGIMITEYLVCRQNQRIGDVIAEFQANRDKYADFSVQYMYVVDDDNRLVGVLRMRDLLFSPRNAVASNIMIAKPISVPAQTALEQLRPLFIERGFFGVPVVEQDGTLVGVVRRASVEEAARERDVRHFLGISGLMGGEEFRSMPLRVRCGRRLSWLSINIVLNIIAASVIALYQETLAAAITLAVFLPMISDMSGCSGNQAAAVSLREMSLGLVRPNELGRVLLKESTLGVINGLALGLLLAAVAMLWKGNPYLGLVVGVSLAANTIVAVSLGGLLPLLLKRFKVDPALVSGPILTTVTDMCGFFFVLSFATLVLPQLATS
jgi:magnesium transporter